MFGGIIKFGSVEERAAVVAHDGIFRGRLGSSAGGDDFVLKAAGKSDDAGLGFVGGEKSLAVFLIDWRWRRLGLPASFSSCRRRLRARPGLVRRSEEVCRCRIRP